jgi:hypothetical protein
VHCAHLCSVERRDGATAGLGLTPLPVFSMHLFLFSPDRIPAHLYRFPYLHRIGRGVRYTAVLG